MANIIEDMQFLPLNIFTLGGRTTANFYLTLRCNMQCKDCYVLHDLPSAPKYQMPAKDVSFYLDELRNKTNFFPAAVLTGGEIFTLPKNYLQGITQRALKKGYLVEWKTNGKFGADAKSRKSVFDMVHQLNIPETSLLLNKDAVEILLNKATEEDKCRCGLYSENEYLAQYGLKMLADQYKLDILTSPLALTVSVDNVVHTEESVKWYKNILQDIVDDSDLRQKICLNHVTLGGTPDQGFYIYEGYFHNFFQGAPKKNPKDPYFGDDCLYKSNGSLEFCFWPDRTVSFESRINSQPFGRVSYVNPNGSYKDLYTIVKDMQAQLLRDYEQKR